MKPFNLQEALAGKPVGTRDGRKVLNIACYTSPETLSFPIRAIIDYPDGFEACEQRYTLNGCYYISECKSDMDLFMQEDFIKPILKPFNIEQAIHAIHTVTTRDGNGIATLYLLDREKYGFPIMAALKGEPNFMFWTIDGIYYPGKQSGLDLFILGPE
jgi:hypothetical protein